MDTFYIKQNDRREPIERILLGSDRLPTDLTGATVKFLMRNVAGAVIVDAAGTIVSAAAGHVRYSWGAGDTATSGVYQGEFEVTFGDGTKQTWPNGEYIVVTVVDDVG